MNTVCVLMSTYNGEKYLEDQIKSVLTQDGVNVHLVVRDDGSHDRTLDILRKYKDIDIIQGTNVGPCRSFLELIRTAPDADYYAFCDQDDIWDEDKLKIAIEQIGLHDGHIPVMYYSNLEVVDEQLKFYRLSHDHNLEGANKYAALMESMPTGCTIVFNKYAEQIMRNRIPDNCTMHDTWIYMVCKMLGEVIYDDHAHIKYRQHGNNVIGTSLKKNSINRYIDKFLRIFNRKLQPVYTNALNFYNQYHDLLSEEDKGKIMLIINYKKGLADRFKLLFSKELVASSNARNFRNRLRIILGIL